jgi:type I restriction enzyme M protein
VTFDDIKARNFNLDIKNPHSVADDLGEPEELLAALKSAENETSALHERLKAILAEALMR